MAVTLNASTSTGLVQSADTSGIITLQNNGTNAVTVDSGNLQFNSGYGSVATAYGCRAWVNFNGSGTPAIRASGNVTSITDNGTGDYTVNFTSAMPDINYSSVGSCSPDSAPSQAVVIMDFSANSNSVVAPTTSALRLSTTVIGAAKDATYISIAIFR